MRRIAASATRTIENAPPRDVDLTPGGGSRQLQRPQKSSPRFAPLQGKYVRRKELYGVLAFWFAAPGNRENDS